MKQSPSPSPRVSRIQAQAPCLRPKDAHRRGVRNLKLGARNPSSAGNAICCPAAWRRKFRLGRLQTQLRHRRAFNTRTAPVTAAISGYRNTWHVCGTVFVRTCLFYKNYEYIMVSSTPPFCVTCSVTVSLSVSLFPFLESFFPWV